MVFEDLKYVLEKFLDEDKQVVLNVSTYKYEERWLIITRDDKILTFSGYGDNIHDRGTWDSIEQFLELAVSENAEEYVVFRKYKGEK